MLDVFHKWLNARLLVGTDPVKVRLLTNYCFYSVIFGLIYSIFYLYIDFVEAFYFLMIAIIIMAANPFLFLISSKNILVANLFLATAWFVIFSIGLLTGGLFSNITPWLAFIIITSVLLTDINNSIIWLIIIVITILGLYLILEEPLMTTVNYNRMYAPFYYCIGYVGLCVLVFITSYIFNDQRKKYVEQLEIQSLNLLTKNAEVEEAYKSFEIKNNELLVANDEIVNQADKIKNINDNLETLVKERTGELEKRNLQLEEYAHMHAHHLRAPICTTIGLYFLLEHPKTKKEEMPELLAKLKETIGELNKVTKEVTKVINV